MKNLFGIIATFLFAAFCTSILVLSLRGLPGNPTPVQMNTNQWKDDGPFELSPERGRFALLMSMVEDKSFHFSLPIARFTTPDLGYSNGKYTSLFAPGISFLVAPGYIAGRMFGLSQVGTYAVIALFGLINALIIRALVIRLGAGVWAGSIAAITYLFATPAFAYSVALYQHQVSTFLILGSLYILERFKSLWALLLIWFLAAASIPIDYPNLFLMFPIGLYALGRIIFLRSHAEKVDVKIKLSGLATFLAAVVPLAFFLWFNQVSYGNPLQLSGTLPSVKAIDEAGNPTVPGVTGQTQREEVFTDPTQQKKSAVGFFKTRQLLNGFYIHFISPDRGILSYTPVILFGIWGMIILYKKNPKLLTVFLGVIGMDVLLYSMWGDPWGGWAFGSRYLIPGYAIMAVLVGVALSNLRKRTVFLFVFFIIFSYSAAVNTLGAITSSRNPPQVEVLAIEAQSGREEKYTAERNLDYLLDNRSKSFVFQTYAHQYMYAWDYFGMITILIISVTGILIVGLRAFSGRSGV